MVEAAQTSKDRAGLCPCLGLAQGDGGETDASGLTLWNYPFLDAFLVFSLSLCIYLPFWVGKNV